MGWPILFISLANAAPLTLIEAYKAALDKTEQAAIETSLTLQSEERIAQARGAMLPSVSLLGGFTRQDVPTGAPASASPNQYSVRLNLSQPLFRGFGEFAEWRRREANQRFQTWRKKRTELDIFEAVAKSYYGVVIAQSDLQDYESLKKLTGERLGELQARVKIGRSRKGEYLLVLSQSSLVDAQIEGAKAILSQAQENFSASTGLDSTSELSPPSLDPAPPPALAACLSLVENRPEIQGQREKITSAEEAIRVVKAGHYPTLDAGANYYFLRSGAIFNSRWDLGVTLVFPLFQGGVVQSQVREALESEKIETLALSSLRRAAQKEMRSSLKALESYSRQFQSLSQALKIAEENYKEQLKDFRNGLSNNLDVLQALNTVEDTKRSRNHTRLQALLARIELDVALGSPTK